MIKLKKVKLAVIGLTLILCGFGTNSSPNNSHALKAAGFDNDNYYSLLTTAIDASDNNTFEDNKNPQIFDSSNEIFKNSVTSRLDVDTYASSIEATSAYEFSNEYAKTFTSTLETSVGVNQVATDVSGKFDTNANTESWTQQIESYEYYYWFAQKYVVNVDWKSESISDALSTTFKRELGEVNSVSSAKALLREYGTHVYKNYVLGGKMEITKYFTQDSSYELSETEKSVSASLNVIVDTAKVDAKVNGSVNLSTYESNSSSSSSYYSKLSYHAYGGDTNGAMNASDLFQYKTQFGTGTASGFLYEAWTNSFNDTDVALKVVSAKNAVAIWDIIDESKYESQIQYLKKAWDNMCYESYAEKCGEFGVPCEYIDSLEYTSKGTTANVQLYEKTVNLPENTIVIIKLSDLITDEFDPSEYELSLSSDTAATLIDDTLTIKDDTIGQSFYIDLKIDGISAYKFLVEIKEESFAGGYGTAQQPYLINSVDNFLDILSDFSFSNNYYSLVNDIDLNGMKIDVGGSGSSSSFEGTFDGNGYSIMNGTVKNSDFKNGFQYVGLFGVNNGTIENLTLKNIICLTNALVQINNSDISLCAGILAGKNNGVISNCLIENSAIRISTNIVQSTAELNIGGLAGASEGLIEESAVSESNIYGISSKGNGQENIGGIVGKLNGAKVSECYVRNTNINAFSSDNTKYSLGGIAGSMNVRTTTDLSEIKSKITMCLVYDTSLNQESSTTGYIGGIDNNSEFDRCYYTALKEQSVAVTQKSGCNREDNISMTNLPASFNENWVDGSNGPILNTFAE